MNDANYSAYAWAGSKFATYDASANAGRECVERAARPLLVAQREHYVELDVLTVDDGRERIARGGGPDHKLAGTVVDDDS
jgi:hypothetical protein